MADQRPATPPPLTHLMRLTDGTGLLQHARYGVPDRRHGYCLDDNARALALMARMGGGPDVSDLATTYASFVDHAWDRDALGGRGRFENFLSFDRQWLPDDGAIENEDAQARGVLALALTAGSTLDSGLREWAASLLTEALRPPALPLALGSPRAWAIALVACDAIIGTPACPLTTEAAEHATAIGPVLAGRMVRRYRAAARSDWPWFEDGLAYDNARLCEGALAGARFDSALHEIGIASLDWLCAVQTAPEGHFRPFGNEGFGQLHTASARYDQQPIEAWATADAARLALHLTGDARWKREAEKAANWFTGENDCGLPLIDEGGGCADGIQRNGPNGNRGAESTLAWLHTALSVQADSSPLTGGDLDRLDRGKGS